MEHIYVMNDDRLLIYDTNLVCMSVLKVETKFRPILHKNYLAIYKTLHKIEENDFVEVKTFKKRISDVQSSDTFTVVCESTGDVWIANQNNNDFRLLLGHFFPINTILFVNDVIITTDNDKIRMSQMDGKILDIFFISNDSVFYNKGFFYIVSGCNITVYSSNNCECNNKNQDISLVLVSKLSTPTKVVNLMFINDHIYVATEQECYLVNHATFKIGVPCLYQFMNAIVVKEHIYFYSKDEQLHRILTSQLK